MNYKYSIIIPVYNVEKYLEECVNSILMQTYKNYEIILVDDGSKDESGKICDELSKKHKKIKVIHQKNGGLSSARNTGIEHATGDYIAFLDSDDYWIDCKNLENINKRIVEENADVLMFNVVKFFDEEELKVNTKKSKDEFTIEELIKYNLYKACATNKIIRKKIIDINKLCFTKGILSEDIEWCGEILKLEKKIIYLNEEVYAYRQRRGSITHSKNKKHIIDIISQCEKALKEKYSNKEIEKIVLSFYAYEFCTAIGLFSLNFINDNETEKKIFENIDILNYCISNKVKKIKLLFKKLPPKIALLIIKIFMKTKE